jgi:cytochrome c-type biogenesis protein CcmH
MMNFVLTGALLALLSLALLTRPLWWRRSGGAAPVDGSDAAALRRQLEQLAALHRSGALGEAAFGDARQALERRLAAALADAPSSPDLTRPHTPKVLLLGLAGFVGAVALAGYALVGTPRGLSAEAVAAAASSADNGHAITSEQIDAMIEKLAARLKDNPADVEGWVMLGRSLAVLGRYDQAVPALKKAVELNGDDAVLLADYADALAVLNNRSLEGEPARLIERALAVDPNNLKALSLAGTIAFNRQDFAGALRHWEKMAQLAPGSELVQQIQGGIDEARQRAGVTTAAAPAPVAAAPASSANAANASVSGTVTLAAALAAKAKPDDTLFVFARATEGPRMPLAILRKQVKDLPLTFTLDDSMAMSPAARLSLAQRVVVGARISKQGSAIAQPGDLQGLSAPVSPGTRAVKIEIAEVVGP